MSISIGLSPLKKNSTAITITINPIKRINTFMPVSPNIFIILEELYRMLYVTIITAITAAIKTIFIEVVVASSIITMALVNAPGPQIIGIANGDPTAKIYIFDRYGKLLNQLSPLTEGWDGSYNGNPMPSSDYWFRVEYTENDTKKEFRGHFTLKR